MFPEYVLEGQEEALVGGYRAEVSPSGVIAVRYEYEPRSATGTFSEAGLAVVLPSDRTELRWIGQGAYAGYPGKDRLNEFGVFHLTQSDLRFQGNRRGTQLALLTTTAGLGVALATPQADIAVQREDSLTLLSHNVFVGSLGNKGSTPETRIKAESVNRISGSFFLVPLAESRPNRLVEFFGKPGPCRKVLSPFYHSYDQ